MTIMPWSGPGANPEQPWDITRRRRGGLFGASAQPPVSAMDGGINDPAAAPKKGFDWRKALGVLGDSLSIAGGGQATYVPNLIDQRNRRQAMDYAEQQYQRRRGDENADWMARQQWERANPKPVNNDTVNDFQWYKGLSADDQKIYDAMHPIVVDVTDESGRVKKQLIRRSDLIGPTVGAVEDGYRFKGGDPADKNSWEPVSSGAPSIGGAPPPPTVVPKASYNAIVQSLGSKAEADAFLRRNGLTVGNF